ncbi:NADPH-dependent 7-cyano-7-deazaguanine reductase [beta proteobacterium AAP99]|nr:NADPH-dependent 7-cyano-7-deazaguanine reductase [beta proteobacterium AAP99]
MASSSNTPEQSQLGRTSSYVDQYDASLLFPIARSIKRDEIGVSGTLPFFGADIWNAYELSWLNPKGKPQVALLQCTVPAESPNIIESKSFKLYLNSFNNTRLANIDALRALLSHDLSEAAGASVGIKLTEQDGFAGERVQELEGRLLDRLDVDCDTYTPDPSLLRVNEDESPTDDLVVSYLLKSNCLVTSQPDWGSVQIRYYGHPIDEAGLLKYIVSFRNHNEFHEQCVERIFMDVLRQCRPTKLAVYARYTRRGGLDINPFRANYPTALPANLRSARQ